MRIKLIESLLARKLQPNRIEQIIERVIRMEHSFTPEPSYYLEKRMATVQREIKPLRNVEEFVLDIYSFVKKASEKQANYIVFPEYIFFDLFHLIPGLSFVNTFLNNRASKTIHGVEKKGNIHTESNKLLTTLFQTIAKPSEVAILTIMRKFAKHFHIYIYTGTYLHKENKQLFNRGTFINPSGEVIMNQDKVHLTDFETSIGLARGNHFKVFPLPIGNVAIPICMDASYFETFRIARSLEADIIIIPIANNEPYDKWRAMRGIWGRVQEAYVYGVKSSLNGWLGGMQFTGKAGFFAPIEMTDNNNGVVTITKHAVGDDVIIADLDVDKLHDVAQNAEYFGDSNPHFEKNYYEKTYLK